MAEGDGDFGVINVVVNAPGAVDTDTTTLTGNITVELNIDPDTDTVNEVTVVSGDITGTQMEFSGGNFLFSYSVESSPTIGCDIVTTSPPGAVDPATGNFDASEHPFQLNEGTLTGETRVLFTATPVAVDFATDPFGSTNSGTGNIQLSLLSSDAVSKTYSVVMIYPIDTTTPLDAGGTAIDVDIDGTVKALGTVTVPLLTEFELWLQDNLLPTSPFEELNQFGLALGIQWALGLNASASPQSAMPQFDNVSPTSTVYTIDLPVGGSAGDLTILYAADLSQPFTSLDTLAVSVGNPIPSGSAGAVTITLPNSGQGFIKLSATEP